MKLRLALAVSLFALAACQPSTPPASESAATATPPAEVATAAPAGACDVSVSAPWIKQDAQSYAVEALVFGPTCKQGVAMLVVRDGAGTPVYTWSGLTDYLFGLRDAADPEAMKTALAEWIFQPTEPDTTATLPAWEETEGQPRRAEFPFMPESWFDKAAWDALKAEALPMFCFPQGIESQQCAVLRKGDGAQPPVMEEIGLQLFPG
jgi:hypothetical protein